MSWNPRRFVASVADDAKIDGDPEYLWVPSDAVERIGMGMDADAFDMHDDAVPSHGVWIGLQEPIETTGGEVDVIRINGSQARRTLLIREAQEMYALPSRVIREKIDEMLASETGTYHDRLLIQGLDHRDTAWLGVGVQVHTADWAVWVPGKEDYDAIRQNLGDDAANAFRDSYAPGAVDTIVDFARAVLSLARHGSERDTHAITATTEQTSLSRKKRGTPKDALDITVLDIRRPPCPPSSSGEEGHGVERTHRWEVSGYYKNQPYGPGASLRKRIWVDSYVAGPEDKPLVRKKKVYRAH